jgi:hypothetical protein
VPKDITSKWGESQALIGPMLVIPVEFTTQDSKGNVQTVVRYIYLLMVLISMILTGLCGFFICESTIAGLCPITRKHRAVRHTGFGDVPDQADRLVYGSKSWRGLRARQ